MWYVYILECQGGTLYTGVTTDVERRLKDHQAKKARYTSYNPPKQMLYQERFDSKSGACKREAEIKRFTRKKKLELIARSS